MPIKDRAVALPIAPGVRIIYRRSSSHPIEYAIALCVVHEGAWRTIYLVDNAHGPREHHAHPYVGDCKQPPYVFTGGTNTVMNDAINTFTACWRTFFAAWERAR